MANYNILKAAIVSAIKQNGNNEITGNLLQQQLLAMVNSLGAGYQFAGVATPTTNPGTPDFNVFYFAGPGTYQYFDGVTIPEQNIGLLSYNGAWNVSTIQTMPFSAETILNDIVQLYDGETPIYPRTRAEAVFFDDDTEKTLDQKMAEIDVDGINQQIEEINYELEHESGPNYVNDSKIYSNGNVVANEGTIASDFIPYVPGSSVLWVYGGAMNQAYICFYDENKSYISEAYWPGGSGTQRSVTASDIQRYAPNAKYLRASFLADYPGALISLDGATVWVPSSGGRGGIIPALEALEQKVEEIDIDAVNAEIQELDAELNNSEPNYLSDSKIYSNGNVVANEGTIASDFIPYVENSSIIYKTGGAISFGYLCCYDENKAFISGAYWSAGSREKTITAAEIQQYAPNCKYIRASFWADSPDASIIMGETVWVPIEATGLKQRVETLEKQVKNVEEQVDSIPPAMSSIAAKVGLQYSKKLHNYFCFIHLSDIHSDAVRMQRMIDFANRYKDRVDCIISTGDFEADYGDAGGFNSTYVATLPSCDVLHFPVIGNHDVGNETSLSAEAPVQTAARMITPYMSQLGATQGGTNAGYYYRDFSEYKVRLIALNEYEMPRIPNTQNTQLKYNIWRRYLSQAQTNWLIQTLMSLQSGWTVVIAMHQPIDLFAKYDNEFKGTVPYAQGDSRDSQNGMLQEIIDAFIGRTTLNKSFPVADAVSSEVPTVVVDANFSTAQGVFSCYINGHTHNDGTGQSSNATAKQVDLNVTCGCIAYAFYDDLYRENGQPSQDAFNVVCIDTDRKECRMIRIGATVNNQMKRRDYACIDYAQN